MNPPAAWANEKPLGRNSLPVTQTTAIDSSGRERIADGVAVLRKL